VADQRESPVVPGIRHSHGRRRRPRARCRLGRTSTLGTPPSGSSRARPAQVTRVDGRRQPALETAPTGRVVTTRSQVPGHRGPAAGAPERSGSPPSPGPDGPAGPSHASRWCRMRLGFLDVFCRVRPSAAPATYGNQPPTNQPPTNQPAARGLEVLRRWPLHTRSLGRTAKVGEGPRPCPDHGAGASMRAAAW